MTKETIRILKDIKAQYEYAVDSGDRELIRDAADKLKNALFNNVDALLEAAETRGEVDEKPVKMTAVVPPTHKKFGNKENTGSV